MQNNNKTYKIVIIEPSMNYINRVEEVDRDEERV